MPNLERQRKRECSQSGCRYTSRCKIYLGNDCKELFGNKIPRMKLFNNTRSVAEQQYSHGFKPYFAQPVSMEEQGRDYL